MCVRARARACVCVCAPPSPEKKKDKKYDYQKKQNKTKQNNTKKKNQKKKKTNKQNKPKPKTNKQTPPPPPPPPPEKQLKTPCDLLCDHPSWIYSAMAVPTPEREMKKVRRGVSNFTRGKKYMIVKVQQGNKLERIHGVEARWGPFAVPSSARRHRGDWKNSMIVWDGKLVHCDLPCVMVK